MIYQNLNHSFYDSLDQIVTNSRYTVQNDIEKYGSNNDKKMLFWFSDEKWVKNKFSNSSLIFDENRNLIAICGNRLLDDNTMKILCHYYVIKKFRNKYQSLHQVIIIPELVKFGKLNNLKGLWYSFDLFDKRHKRYSESQKRLLRGSKVPIEFIPYWNKFEFLGETVYNNVKQDKFFMKLN
jgi:hypothetical protein